MSLFPLIVTNEIAFYNYVSLGTGFLIVNYITSFLNASSLIDANSDSLTIN
jgi:hypothetical protein